MIWVELTSRRQAVVVDASTETAAVGVVESSWRVGGRRRQWMRRQRRREWVWWSRAGELEAGDGGGSVDRDGGSGSVGVELACRRQATAYERLMVEMR